MRDRLDVPRNDDGSYDARAVAEWSVGRRQLVDMTDAEVERCYCIADLLHEASYELSGSVVATIRGLQTKYGERALATFGSVLLERWSYTVDRYPEDWRPPTDEEQQRYEREEQERQRAKDLDDAARAELRVAFVCDRCQKLRRGRRWVDEEPPVGYVVTDDVCPACTIK